MCFSLSSAWGHDYKLADNWNFDKLLETSQKLAVSAFFSVAVAEDDKNSSANILQVYLQLSRFFFETASILAESLQFPGLMS